MHGSGEGLCRLGHPPKREGNPMFGKKNHNIYKQEPKMSKREKEMRAKPKSCGYCHGLRSDRCRHCGGTGKR